MERATARERLDRARVAYLATLAIDSRPRIVPCCFVLDDSTVYSAVDAKPKSTLTLGRIQNLETNAGFSLLVDHYDEDWMTLWWVRVDGSGRVIKEGKDREHALDLLAAKYEQYRDTRPPGPVLVLDIERWSMWP